MNELINQARELCDAAKSAKERGDALDSAAMSWAITNNCVPQLCDALEAAEKEISAGEEQIAKLATLILRYENEIVPPFKKLVDAKDAKIAELTARAEKVEENASRLINQMEEYKHKFNAALVRAEKAEAEISELRTPKQAVALKMDTMVQIGHVRFGRGCTVRKCPCCGTFLTPTHKYCLECGQAVSFPNSTEEE